jgi:hypothetical protein
MTLSRTGLPEDWGSLGLHTRPDEGGIRGWGLLDRLGTRQQIQVVPGRFWAGLGLEDIALQLQADLPFRHGLVVLDVAVHRSAHRAKGPEPGAYGRPLGRELIRHLSLTRHQVSRIARRAWPVLGVSALGTVLDTHGGSVPAPHGYEAAHECDTPHPTTPFPKLPPPCTRPEVSSAGPGLVAAPVIPLWARRPSICLTPTTGRPDRPHGCRRGLDLG